MALTELSKVASEDNNYQEVVNIVLSGKYDSKELRKLHKDHPAHQYSAQWASIGVHGIFLTYHGRMVVPVAKKCFPTCTYNTRVNQKH